MCCSLFQLVQVYLLRQLLFLTYVARGCLLLRFQCIGMFFISPIASCIVASSGKMVATSTLEAFSSGGWTCVSVVVCPVATLGADWPVRRLRAVSGSIRTLIPHTVPSWSADPLHLRVILSLAVAILASFYHLTAFVGYFKRLCGFSYRFQVSIFPYDFVAKLGVLCLYHSHHDYCVVQRDGEVTVKRLLPAFRLKIRKVHIRCPSGVKPLVKLQGVVAIRFEVLI